LGELLAQQLGGEEALGAVGELILREEPLALGQVRQQPVLQQRSTWSPVSAETGTISMKAWRSPSSARNGSSASCRRPGRPC
jgi:hypothetical protein